MIEPTTIEPYAGVDVARGPGTISLLPRSSSSESFSFCLQALPARPL